LKVDDLKKGDLVRWWHIGGRNILERDRGIVLEESRCGAGYRVQWFGGGVGEHYRSELVKIEVESD
jgi:hypothetical protein